MILIQFLLQTIILIAIFAFAIRAVVISVRFYKSSKLSDSLFEPALTILASILLTIVALCIQTISHYLQGHHMFYLAAPHHGDGWMLQHKAFFALSVLQELIVRPLWWYMCIIGIGGWLKLSLHLPRHSTYKKTVYDLLITLASTLIPVLLVTYDNNVRYNVSQLIRVVSVVGSALLLLVAFWQASKTITPWIKQLLYIIGSWSILNSAYYLFDLWQMNRNGIALHSQANTLLICASITVQLNIIYRLLRSVENQ